MVALSQENVLLLQQDHSYKDLPDLIMDQRARQNLDHPDSLDAPRIIEYVRQLRPGGRLNVPVTNSNSSKGGRNEAGIDLEIRLIYSPVRVRASSRIGCLQNLPTVDE